MQAVPRLTSKPIVALQSLASRLEQDNSLELHVHLVALAELAISGPDAFEAESTVVVSFVLSTFAQPDQDVS